MSPFRKSDDVLNEWRAVADRAARPSHAPRGSASRSQLPIGMAALAALLVVAAILSARAFVANGPASGSSPSAVPSESASAAVSSRPSPSEVQATPSASESRLPGDTNVPTPSATPPAVSGITFSTPGVAASWQSFSWSPVPSGNPDQSPLNWNDFYGPAVHWAHGYALVGLPRGDPLAQGLGEGVWTSPDGVTWTRTLMAPYVQVAEAPAGLVAITAESTSEGAGQTAWSSADGTHWTNLGIPRGPEKVASLAGTRAGLVAISRSGSNQDQAMFSTDGLNWSGVTVEPGLQWDESGAAVQAGNGRFFLMGGLTPGSGMGPNAVIFASSMPTGHVWWSDDGKTWTRSSNINGYGTRIDFGRDGLLLHTDYRATPGGVGLERSTDGGKTWTADPRFGPLGEQVCRGECGIGPNGVMGSNGDIFLAVGPGGHAWTSTDGKTWSSIAWSGPLTQDNLQTLQILPRGVLIHGQYGAAK